MPDRPDYAALTRGQIAVLDRINAGEAGLAVLNQLVRLAQDVLGGRGAGFAEYSPGPRPDHRRQRRLRRRAGPPGRPRRRPARPGTRTQLIPLDSLNDEFAGQIEGGDLRRMLGARCEIGGADRRLPARLLRRGATASPAPSTTRCSSCSPPYVAHMYGDQAGLPVHGDGPVVAALADGLAIVDRDGVVQLWNPAAEQLTGRTAAEMLHRELHVPGAAAGPGAGPPAAVGPLAEGDRR